MSSLSKEQKQLLFDYCLGLTSGKETAEAEALLFSSEEAAKLRSRLKSSLQPLDTLERESCPDQLAERTVERLNNCARSSQVRLQQLLTAEQARTTPTTSRAWWSLGRIAAAAAVILITLAILFPPIGRLRYGSRLYACQMGLNRIFRGIQQYKDEHNDEMPTVPMALGAPWWKVGYQGKENHSATRNMWLLVKGNYVNPADFICPGKKQKLAIRLSSLQIQHASDFPAREYITYSIRIRCSNSTELQMRSRKVLITDVSPLFENVPQDFTKPLTLELDQELFTRNSINHNRHGQNALFCDGAVKFIKERHTDISYDDIFTVQNMCIGCRVKGCEVPSSESDTFLAP